MNMIHMVFADASLELVPSNLLSHPAVKKYAQRYNKGTCILLDDSYHHAAMRNLAHWEKRGRPDIVHFCLLETLGSPLCKEEKMKVHVHTWEGHHLEIAPETRLPRNYMRFKGLFEQVLDQKGTKGGLISVEEKVPIKALIQNLQCKEVIGFSRKGETKKLGEVFSDRDMEENIAVLVGAFPRGAFSESVTEAITHMIAIYPEPLEAWIVTSRVLTQLEMLFGVF
ncbi:MAG: 16S rRNA methyltransferase [Thermoplasmata archaeon]|nr:MAG: 16S rRNA methyltransferase [Thermoplasmata archaeon]